MFYLAFKYFITALKARKYGGSVSNVEDGQNWVPVARDKIYGTGWIKRRRVSVHRWHLTCFAFDLSLSTRMIASLSD